MGLQEPTFMPIPLMEHLNCRLPAHTKILMRAEALINTGQVGSGFVINWWCASIYGGRAYRCIWYRPPTAAHRQKRNWGEKGWYLLFRGLSFYDARRFKISEPVSAGGGRTGCIVIANSGAVNTNAIIEYGYLDYWDVPDNELAYNPFPGKESKTIKAKQNKYKRNPQLNNRGFFLPNLISSSCWSKNLYSVRW